MPPHPRGLPTLEVALNNQGLNARTVRQQARCGTAAQHHQGGAKTIDVGASRPRGSRQGPWVGRPVAGFRICAGNACAMKNVRSPRGGHDGAILHMQHPQQRSGAAGSRKPTRQGRPWSCPISKDVATAIEHGILDTLGFQGLARLQNGQLGDAPRSSAMPALRR